jgi:hypothetical protein
MVEIKAEPENISLIEEGYGTPGNRIELGDPLYVGNVVGSHNHLIGLNIPLPTPLGQGEQQKGSGEVLGISSAHHSHAGIHGIGEIPVETKEAQDAQEPQNSPTTISWIETALEQYPDLQTVTQ